MERTLLINPHTPKIPHKGPFSLGVTVSFKERNICKIFGMIFFNQKQRIFTSVFF